MLTFSSIGIALLGLVFTVDGQTVAPDPRCDAFRDGIGNIMVEGMDCRYYLSCWNFIIAYEPMHCAGGTIFNPDTGMCDAEECNEGNTRSQYACQEGALPGDCSRYNLCFNTPNVTFQCGEQTYYHNEMLVCVNPSEYPDLPEEQGCAYNP
ncbi:uncharacterized protein LOC124136984 [Haliotis rufescens]|uniref:uncharacterized protein LOC124136984 n=1 Tax=Haliotis rufescens TaxID=6454 RepID=UPI001EB041DE|nr:uncharacterized protein LOC124136984 [Haliotis rufescens]